MVTLAILRAASCSPRPDLSFEGRRPDAHARRAAADPAVHHRAGDVWLAGIAVSRTETSDAWSTDIQTTVSGGVAEDSKVERHRLLCAAGNLHPVARQRR
jgi:hypothetical protein